VPVPEQQTSVCVPASPTIKVNVATSESVSSSVTVNLIVYVSGTAGVNGKVQARAVATGTLLLFNACQSVVCVSCVPTSVKPATE